LVTSLNLKNTILVGGDFEKINQPYPFFKNSNEAVPWLNENMPTNALVLIKGSRGIKMEKLMDCF
jgi:UDP-N-acetylmuramoyl-tripeptide--D-alanyl-D-alanine ligase